MLLIASPDFERHLTPPGHPERPERAHVFAAVAEHWRQAGLTVVEPEAVTRAALERRESRGAHTRVEFPQSEKQFGTVSVIIRRQGTDMTVTQEPILPLPPELQRILDEG